VGVLQTALCPVTVGRENELDLLTGVLREARDGDGRTFVLCGDAGLGKTRLAGDVRRAAAEHGMLALWGGCSEAELSLPYLPFLEAIGNHLAQADLPALRRQLTANQRELAWLFPQLELTEPLQDPSDPVQGKLRLYEAVHTLLRICAASGGLLLVLENVHWADASSRELLEYLVRRLRGTRTMLLVTCRLEGLNRRDPLLVMVEHWRRAGLAEHVELGPLSAEGIGAMVQATVGEAAGFEVRRLLRERSEGNPFVLEEMLKEAMDRGAVSSDVLRVEALERLRLPRTVRDSVLDRIAQLPEAAAEVLRCASVLGRSFDYALLVALSGRDQQAVRAALRMCLGLQLLEEDPDTEGNYRFRHSLTREAVYGDLLAPQREELHAAAADALAARPGTPPVDLCRHLLAAHRDAEAVPLGLEAAERAVRAHAYHDASLLYERILPLVTDEARRADLRCRMGTAFLLHGDTAHAERHLFEGVRALERLGDERTAARYRLWLGRCHWERSRHDLAALEYETARASLEPLGASEDLALAYVRLASLSAFQLDGERAIERASRAIEIATEAAADAPRIWAYNFLGLGHIQLGHIVEGLGDVDRSYREAAEHGLNVIAANALYSGVMVRVQTLRPLEAVAKLDALKSIQAGSMGQLQALRAEGTLYLWGLGQPGRAHTAFQEAMALAREGQAHNYVSWLQVQLAVVHIHLDQLDQARRLLPDRGGDRERQDRVVELWAAMRLELDSGRPESALGAAREVRAGEWPLRVRLTLGDVAVETFARAGLADEARALLDGVAAADPSNPYRLRMRGRLAAAEGRLEEAVELLQAAAETLRTAGMRHEEGRSRLALAEALADLGRVPEAQAELRAVLDSAESRGAAFEARAAREALVSLGSRAITADHVKQALESLHRPLDLARTELGPLLGLDGDTDGSRLRELLIEHVGLLAGSADGRDREAGKLLRDYYVRRVGSQELVADRLHLTRATFYRRLHLGWSLLAERLALA
jgi:tetratricopeptide (TPR) repeat protein